MVRLLLFALLWLWSGDLLAQSNDLDELYTPPTNAKFNQLPSKTSGASLLGDKENDNYAWAIKYSLHHVLKGHHQFGFELSLNNFLGIEPQIGVLLNKSDMYTNRFNGEPSLYREAVGVRPENYAPSAISYRSLLNLAEQRSGTIPSFGLLVNLYDRSEGFLEGYNLMLQLGYQFQHMRYSLADTLSGVVVPLDSRTGYMRRQQLMVFGGLQALFGDQFPFIVEYGLVFAYNILSAPTFSRDVISSTNNTLAYQKREYGNSFEPFVGLRLRIGFGYNR